MQTTATKQQVKAINAFLATRGLMEMKKQIISNFTNDRTDRSSLLTKDEARALLLYLNDYAPLERMIKKIVAMAHEIHWIKKTTIVDPKNGVVEERDYKALDEWILKYGYLHKPLFQYTYQELPKLLTQFEYGPYKHFLERLS